MSDTTMNVLIRRAELNDLKNIQDLNHKLFLWDLDRDPALNTSWPYEEAGEYYFRKRISREVGVCFVADYQGRILGYVAGRILIKK